MLVTDEHVAILRSYLTGDFHLYEQLHAQIDPAGKPGFGALLFTAFFEAVDRRFANPETTDSDLVEYVGGVRSRSEGISEEIDPRSAERLMRSVLTGEDTSDLDSEASVKAQFFVLYALVQDERLDSSGLDKFLAEARRLADEEFG